MKYYTKLIIQPKRDVMQQCEAKMKKISQVSNLDLYMSAPEGMLAVMVNGNDKPQTLFYAENYHDMLDMLLAIENYIEVMKESK